MANSILPNSFYLLKFSKEQLDDHRELLVVSATLSEWFKHVSNAEEGPLTSHSMVSALKQFLHWIEEGHRLSQRWNELVSRLDPIYDTSFRLQ